MKCKTKGCKGDIDLELNEIDDTEVEVTGECDICENTYYVYVKRSQFKLLDQ